MKLDMQLYNRICDITGTDYEMAKSSDEDSVLAYRDLDSIIENLVDAYDHLEEEYKELEKDMHENYQPIPFDPYAEYGISERDFH